MTWTTVRVSLDTKARLEALRETWSECAETMFFPLHSTETRSGKESTRDQIGLDQVIRVLIMLHERHGQRRRDSAQRKRAGG